MIRLICVATILVLTLGLGCIAAVSFSPVSSHPGNGVFLPNVLMVVLIYFALVGINVWLFRAVAIRSIAAWYLEIMISLAAAMSLVFITTFQSILTPLVIINGLVHAYILCALSGSDSLGWFGVRNHTFRQH